MDNKAYNDGGYLMYIPRTHILVAFLKNGLYINIMMKIPSKILWDMVMDGSLQKYDKGKDKWIKVKFDPDNEEHVNIKMQHYAQAEIEFVHETLELGLRVFREIN